MTEDYLRTGFFVRKFMCGSVLRLFFTLIWKIMMWMEKMRYVNESCVEERSATHKTE